MRHKPRDKAENKTTITISRAPIQRRTHCGRHEIKQKQILAKAIAWLLDNIKIEQKKRELGKTTPSGSRLET